MKFGRAASISIRTTRAAINLRPRCCGRRNAGVDIIDCALGVRWMSGNGPASRTSIPIVRGAEAYAARYGA